MFTFTEYEPRIFFTASEKDNGTHEKPCFLVAEILIWSLFASETEEGLSNNL